ncbi:uncharacterized protein LOC132699687 [Cylas formicarius]|uniref:uncharacterized protein LOC132699687 n=1 Tax=Cylas formicarius TaxID=197179 RepID=UPI0029584926|nr:uncharacterized protein LOC132699687 [Cylas formicarius]
MFKGQITHPGCVAPPAPDSSRYVPTSVFVLVRIRSDLRVISCVLLCQCVHENGRRSPSPSPGSSVTREGKSSVLTILQRLEHRMDVLEKKNWKKTRQLLSESSCESAPSSQNPSDCSDVENNEEEDVTCLTKTDNLNDQRSGSLEPEILSLIGDEGGNNKDSGPPIQQNVINIAQKGLHPEKRKNLLTKYTCPENGMGLRPPKLNTVVKEATTEAVQTRDHRLSNLQAQIASCLSAIGLVVTDLLKAQKLSDAGRLLSDIHNRETISRRNLVSMNLNKDLKKTLLDSPIDEWLFGQLKSAKPFTKKPGTARAYRTPYRPTFP